MLLYVQHRGNPAEFWCSEVKMGQMSSVPGDMDQTPEVLSTTSGRALCLVLLEQFQSTYSNISVLSVNLVN